MAPPKLLDWHRYYAISGQLEEAKGKGELENVISEIEEAIKDDRSILESHHGISARKQLNMAIESNKSGQEEAETKAKLTTSLDFIERALNDKYDLDGGRRRRKTRSTRPLGRRGRKSRRKSLRQRK